MNISEDENIFDSQIILNVHDVIKIIAVLKPPVRYPIHNMSKIGDLNNSFTFLMA